MLRLACKAVINPILLRERVSGNGAMGCRPTLFAEKRVYLRVMHAALLERLTLTLERKLL